MLCDFDGTISPTDTTDALLERHADPAWLEVEAAWERGDIDARTCMSRQVALLRMERTDLEAFVDGLEIDPHVPAFAEACRVADVDLIVVSDGLAEVIAPLLARAGLNLPLRANRLVGTSAGWQLGAPFASEHCRAGSAHCKCGALADAGAGVVVIGDGRSDLCVARRADLVLARDGDAGPSTLLKACRREGLRHRPFRTFADVLAELRPWLVAAATRASA